MIYLELYKFFVNILFGLFESIIYHIISFTTSKIANIYLAQITSFVLYLLTGILYLFYIENIFLDFNIYFLFVMLLGFFIGNKLFKSETIRRLVSLVSIFNWLKFFLYKLFLFSINYNLFLAIKGEISKKIKKNK